MSKQWLNEEALDVLVNYYYPRAKWLQDNCNWGAVPYTGPEATAAVNDPIMQEIDIYDCFSRNAAGFSNVLQDLKFMTDTPKWHHQNAARHKIIEGYNTKGWDLKTWMFVYLGHRVFGSGASFEDDHGYRNNCVQHWGHMSNWQEMADDAVARKATGQPLFTSKGNQPPSPRKGVSCVDYLVNEAPGQLDDLIEWLNTGTKKTHKAVVDFLNEHNLREGHKRFNFIYAAFSYDLGDYHKDLIDDQSHGYFGNNAVRCMKRLSTGYTTDEFMDILSERTGGAPRDLEDVMCDFVRFGQNYVPRGNGTFDHINSTIQNNSGWDSGWDQRQGEGKEKGVQIDAFML